MPLLSTGAWDPSARTPPPPASGPVDQRLRALLPEGMGSLAGEPMGLCPPEGFSRQSSFRRDVGGLSYEVAGYRGPGDLDAVLRHYRSLLEARGFVPAGAPDAPAGARTVVFAKEGTKIILRLHKNRRQENIIDVLVTAMRPAGTIPTDEGK